MLDEAMTTIDLQIIDVIGVKAAAFIDLILPIITACFVIYAIFISINYMQSKVTVIDVGWDILLRFLGLVFILGIGLNSEQYTTYVVNFVNVLPDGLITEMTGNDPVAETIGARLDNLIELYIIKINSLYMNLEYSDVGGHVIASTIVVMFAICTFPFLIVCAGLVLLSDIVISVLLAIGPVFFAFALFPSTRRFFGLWIGQLLKYILILVVIKILAAVQIPFLVNLIAVGLDTSQTPVTVTSGLTFTSTIEIGLISLLFFIINIKIVSFANGLSNGVNLSAAKSTA